MSDQGQPDVGAHLMSLAQKMRAMVGADDSAGLCSLIEQRGELIDQARQGGWEVTLPPTTASYLAATDEQCERYLQDKVRGLGQDLAEISGWRQGLGGYGGLANARPRFIDRRG